MELLCGSPCQTLDERRRSAVTHKISPFPVIPKRKPSLQRAFLFRTDLAKNEKDFTPRCERLANLNDSQIILVGRKTKKLCFGKLRSESTL